MKKYIVKLTEQEREELEQMISSGKHSARKLTHARILLKADQGPGGPHWTDEQIVEAIGASPSTIGRVRQQLVEEGVDGAISRRKGSGIRELKIDGEREAHLVALTCSTPPEGQAKWTLRLLAAKMIELEYIESVSHETVRRTLKKTNSNPGKRSNGAFHQRKALNLSVIWKMSFRSMSGLMMKTIP